MAQNTLYTHYITCCSAHDPSANVAGTFTNLMHTHITPHVIVCAYESTHFPRYQNYTGNQLDTLRPRQNDRLFPDDIFKCIFLNENVWISLMISLKFVPKVPINNIPALVQMMAWRRPGAKSLSELMLVKVVTHIYVTRPQWVRKVISYFNIELR